MTAVQTLITAYARGVRLWVAGSGLKFEAKEAIPDDLYEALIANKAEIIRHLTGPPPDPGAELVIIQSTDPAAVGGRWIGSMWFPPPEVAR